MFANIHSRELQCNTYSLGGLIRNSVHEKFVEIPQQVDTSNKKKKSTKKSAASFDSKKELTKGLLKEVGKRKKYMRMGMQPICVFDVTDSEDRKANIPHEVQIPQYPILMISTMTNVLSKEFRALSGAAAGSREVADKKRELAMFTFDSARAYAEMYKVKSRMTAFRDRLALAARDTLVKDLDTIHKHMNEAVDSSLKFWDETGQVGI